MRRKYIHKAYLDASHPAAKLLQDDLLAPFVQWVLEETPESGRRSTYLLLSVKAYKASCKKFSALADTSHSALVRVSELRDEQTVEREANNERLFELEQTLRTLRDREDEVGRLFDRAESELQAATQLKTDLLRLIETAKLEDAPTRVKSMFDVIEAKAPKAPIPHWIRRRKK